MTLMEAFALLPEPRTGPAQRHDLREMILMALCAALCGANTWVDVAEWTEDQLDWLRQYIPAKGGAPSHDTFGRVFRLLDAALFEQITRRLIGAMSPGRARLPISPSTSTAGKLPSRRSRASALSWFCKPARQWHMRTHG